MLIEFAGYFQDGNNKPYRSVLEVARHIRGRSFGSEGIPGGARREFEIPEIGTEAEPDARADRYDHDIVRCVIRLMIRFLLSDEALTLEVGPLGILVLGCRDRHHSRSEYHPPTK